MDLPTLDSAILHLDGIIISLLPTEEDRFFLEEWKGIQDSRPLLTLPEARLLKVHVKEAVKIRKVQEESSTLASNNIVSDSSIRLHPRNGVSNPIANQGQIVVIDVDTPSSETNEVPRTLSPLALAMGVFPKP
jgi:hypothetical protein